MKMSHLTYEVATLKPTLSIPRLMLPWPFLDRATVFSINTGGRPGVWRAITHFIAETKRAPHILGIEEAARRLNSHGYSSFYAKASHPHVENSELGCSRHIRRKHTNTAHSMRGLFLRRNCIPPRQHLLEEALVTANDIMTAHEANPAAATHDGNFYYKHTILGKGEPRSITYGAIAASSPPTKPTTQRGVPVTKPNGSKINTEASSSDHTPRATTTTGRNKCPSLGLRQQPRRNSDVYRDGEHPPDTIWQFYNLVLFQCFPSSAAQAGNSSPDNTAQQEVFNLWKKKASAPQAKKQTPQHTRVTPRTKRNHG